MEAGAGGLAELRTSELLDRVAARTPAPGGGTVAALSCSLAASLLQMSAAFDETPMGAASGVRADALRGRALELAERELGSYQPVLEALALPIADPSREERLAAARSAASTAPLAIASVAAQLAGIAAEVMTSTSEHVIGDALVAAELAEGACRAATRLVEVNLAGVTDDPRLSEAAALVSSAAESRAEALHKAADG
ncbi:MAG: cyclodeaminase/cyclohydrolase family protein [Solirubrobacterales bacterium]|nr:cyclodeaminase/cyclohydrolase family protein [Solirubrobacterales bacterium]